MITPFPIPRIRFASLPTPIEPLPRLSVSLGGPKILVKRDDLTGLALGGNKTRKLEFVLAEAQAHGARTIITVGAAQSNHCRQTAALAAKLGLRCILVLSGEPEPYPTGNLLMDDMFGARIVWASVENRLSVLEYTFDVEWEDGQRPYVIPLGASNALGTLAYEAAFQEFLAQSVDVDWIITASSSGGTQAGLVLGARRNDWPGRVLGISVDRKKEELCELIASLANAAAEKAGYKVVLSPDEILINPDYLGDGYGIMGPLEQEAIRLFARLEGLLLDPVYTGKAAAGMIDMVRKGYFHSSESILFWHTGGTPALFASRYSSQLVQG